MENLRRLAGEAGVLAGIATAWLFLGLVLVFPSAGLNLADQANPHRYIPYIAKHAGMFWTVNVLGGIAAAVFTAIFVMGLADRFREGSPATAKIGSWLGVFGATSFAAAAAIRQIGFTSLIPVYKTAHTSGAVAFYGTNGVVHGLLGLGGIVAGLGVLVFAGIMLKSARYSSVGFLSVAAGTVMILDGFVNNVYFFMGSFMAMIVWLIWTSLTLRAEVGPALFHVRFAPRRNGRARHAA